MPQSVPQLLIAHNMTCLLKKTSSNPDEMDLSNLPEIAKLGDLTVIVDQIRDDEVSELFDISRQSTSAGIKQAEAPDTLDEMKTTVKKY